MLKQALRILALMMLSSSIAAATPVAGQSVIYRYDSTHSYAAVVAKANGDGTADLVVLNCCTYSFGFGLSSRYDWPVTYMQGVTEGSTDNRWAVNPDIGLGATGPTGATGATGAAGSTGPAGPGSLVVSSSTPTLSIGGSAVQFSTTADTIYTVSVKITTTLTLSGGAAGHVDLLCDSSATPSTIVATVQGESTGTLTVGLNLQASNTLVMHWRVPVSHRCRLTSTNDTGTPTYSITRQVLQTLG